MTEIKLDVAPYLQSIERAQKAIERTLEGKSRPKRYITEAFDGSDIDNLDDFAAINGIDAKLAPYAVLEAKDAATELVTEAKDIVRSQAGAAHYHQPIGSLIRRMPHGITAPKRRRLAQAIEHIDGGFTVDPRHVSRTPRDGFQVGIDGHTMKIGGDVPSLDDLKKMDEKKLADEVDKWLKANADCFDSSDMMVGGWLDSDTGKVYLDVSEHVPTRDEAIKLGKQRDQIAVWDNAHSQEIDTGGTGQKSWAGEPKHPRGWHGRWVHLGDEHGPFVPTRDLAPALMHRGRPDGTGTALDPIDVQGNIDRALTLLAQGKHVRLNQPDEVALLVKGINHYADEFKKRGGKLPTIDLGKLSVKGTNLFAEQNKGIPRIKMPQLTGVPAPGSHAERVAGGPGHYADMIDDFKKRLVADGVKVKDQKLPASHLRATQTELDGEKVAALVKAYQDGDPFVRKLFKEPLWVTRDNYVIDGHHRWAAGMVLDAMNGKIGDDYTQEVRKADMDIGAAIPYANAYADEVGLARHDLHADTALVGGH